ncbi:MAG: CBS domain-containing protein, partial [Gemmatimonadota bacterium]|nr:CBS domain-containing protein [Gemmatimonadota bacterium]
MKKSAHHTEKLRKQIDELAASGKLRSISDQAVELHPSDLADLIESLDEKYRVEILCTLPTTLASETLAEMDEGEGRAELLVALPAEKVAELLKELADDDATDLIGELGPEDQRSILAALPVDEAGDIKRLLSYGEETAGGLMTTELVEVEGSLRADEAIGQVRIQGRDVEDFYTVFVIDQTRRLLGTMRLDDLVVADPAASIEGLVEEPSVTVSPDVDQEEVGRLLGRYNLAAIPVVTDEGVLLGRITFDDV